MRSILERVKELTAEQDSVESYGYLLGRGDCAQLNVKKLFPCPVTIQCQNATLLCPRADPAVVDRERKSGVFMGEWRYQKGVVVFFSLRDKWGEKTEFNGVWEWSELETTWFPFVSYDTFHAVTGRYPGDPTTTNLLLKREQRTSYSVTLDPKEFTRR